MSQTRDVRGYLTTQKSRHDGLGEHFSVLEDLYNRKLWHQLTTKLQQLIELPNLQTGDGLLQLYNNFIADFEGKINQLALASILLVTAKQIAEPSASIAFLESVLAKVKDNKLAQILVRTQIAQLKLHSGDLTVSHSMIEELEAALDLLDEIPSHINAAFFRLSSDYYKVIGDFKLFYRDALKFLGCVDLNALPELEKQQRAFDLGLSALLGADIYNFGELLSHEILGSLASSPYHWMVPLLHAFKNGDINAYNQLQPQWSTQADLSKSATKLREKISLMGLMELIFKRPAEDRAIPFSEIAAGTQIPPSQVELLVMRGLSLGLIKGTIDQVTETVHVTWVRPRVLDLTEVGYLQSRLAKWAENVSKTVLMMENASPELFVA
eukprot:Colp12_sorted_trinity150504_noHs@20194